MIEEKTVLGQKVKIAVVPMAKPTKFPMGKYGFLAQGHSWNYHFDSQGKWVQGQVDGEGLHAGVDEMNDEGTPLPSPLKFKVIKCGLHINADGSIGAYGHRILGLTDELYECSDGVKRRMYITIAHLQEVQVQVGQVVEVGQVVGLSGSSGNTHGVAHTHYQLEEEGAFPRKPAEPRMGVI